MFCFFLSEFHGRETNFALPHILQPINVCVTKKHCRTLLLHTAVLLRWHSLTQSESVQGGCSESTFDFQKCCREKGVLQTGFFSGSSAIQLSDSHVS